MIIVKLFSSLITSLDETTSMNARLLALQQYFERAPEADALWAIALFTGRRPRRPINTTLIRQWAAAQAGIPEWLFEESYHVVGDLAEAIALVLPAPAAPSGRSLHQWMHWLMELRNLDVEEQKAAVIGAWESLVREERFVFNKLITGGFRIGVSQQMIVKALAAHSGQEESMIAHRLMGRWDPLTTTFKELLEEGTRTDLSKPYPFYLAYALDQEPETLGDPAEWQAEWKWDGIRGQVIVRQRQLFVWSRGEELVTEKYPEYHDFTEVLPDGTVIDGEILAFRDDMPLNFNALQQRIGRKTVSKKLREEVPVILMAYDVLELNGEDIRHWPLHARRAALEELVAKALHPTLLLSRTIKFSSWDELARERDKSRQWMSEGIMLKHRESTYQAGRKRGDWWKWKVDPYTIDAVLVYAMRGHGRRANLYTDYTFAVWEEGHLVPFAKAYSGLTDEEFREVDAFVKRNTIERFGPVRSVKPELVFELAFEGIARSGRHKSGVALRFPRMKRWRRDKPAEEANTLSDLMELL